MRTLLVHNRYQAASSSGEDRVVDLEAAALVDAGHTVETYERFSDDIASRSIVGKALVPGQVVWSEHTRRSLVRRLRTTVTDVVHIHNTFPVISASVLYACRAVKVPVVTTIHNYRLACPSGDFFRDGAVCHDCVGRAPVPAVRHRCYRDSVLATLPLAASVVAHRQSWQRMVSAYVFLSSAQRNALAPFGIPSERSFVKPNFVPLIDAPSIQREDVVAYAGRLTAAKGIELLMDAWDRYLESPGEGRLRLVVAGSGPYEERVTSWAANRPSVDYVGRLGRDDCASLLARSRAVILPSQWEETFGLVAVEAMAASTPPIAPAHGSFPELIIDGKDGILFEPGNALTLAAVLRDVDSRRERYEELGAAARRTYEQRFTPTSNIEQLLRIYEFAVKHPVY